MAATQELDAPQFAFLVQLLGEQILPAVDDGLHHHVDLAALPLRLDDAPAFVDGRRRGHGARHVLAGLERRDRLRGVIRDGRVDMHGVDIRVCQQVFVARIPCRDPELLAAGVELFPVATADAVHLGIRVSLVDGNELGAEAQTHDRHSHFICHQTSPSE
jgi:hypothetical protein